MLAAALQVLGACALVLGVLVLAGYGWALVVAAVALLAFGITLERTVG